MSISDLQSGLQPVCRERAASDAAPPTSRVRAAAGAESAAGIGIKAWPFGQSQSPEEREGLVIPATDSSQLPPWWAERLLGGLTLLVIGVLTVIALYDYQTLWIVKGALVLQPSLILSLTLFLLLALSGGTTRAQWVTDLSLALVLTSLYTAVSVNGLGDIFWHHSWRGMSIAGSEILGMGIYMVAVRIGLNPGLVPPVIGFFTALSFFWATNQLFQGEERRWRVWSRLFYLTAGMHIVFFRNYAEHTTLSVPFVLLMVGALLRYATEIPGLRWLIAASLAFCAAALAHGQACFLAPLIPLVIMYRQAALGGRGGQVGRRILAHLAVWFAVLILVGAACYAVLQALGVSLWLGNANGGGDGAMFVPLQDATQYTRFFFFSYEHLLQTANIVFAAVPLLVGYALVSLQSISRAGTRIYLAAEKRAVLCLASLGYVSFIVLWNFDLGYPVDYDLMVTLSAPLLLLVGAQVYSAAHRSRILLGALFAAAITLSWAHQCGILLVRGSFGAQLRYEDYARDVPYGMVWSDPGNSVIQSGQSTSFILDKERTADSLLISTDCNDTYEVLFYHQFNQVGSLLVPYGHCPGLFNHRIPLVWALAGRTFDRIIVRPVAGDGFYAIGQLRLHGESAGEIVASTSE